MNLSLFDINTCVDAYQYRLEQLADIPRRGYDSPLGDRNSGEQDQTNDGVHISIRPSFGGLTLLQTIEVLSGISIAASPPAYQGRNFVEEARIGIVIDGSPVGNAEMLKSDRDEVQEDNVYQ